MPLPLDSEGHRIPLAVRMQIAEFLQAAGRRPKFSSYIGGEIIAAGYGRLNECGDWEYPLL